jgi:hypothetical protein
MALRADLPYLSLLTKVNVAVLPAGLVGYRHYPSGELYSLGENYWAGRERVDREKVEHGGTGQERIDPP